MITLDPQTAAQVLRELRTRSTHEVARAIGVSQSALAVWARRNAPWVRKRSGGARLRRRKAR